MELSCNLGTVRCDTEKEIRAFLLTCAAEGADDIWIYNGEEEYPCLGVLVNPTAACVHYFASATEHYQSAGEEAAAVQSEFLCAGERTVMPAYTVIPLANAIECVVEFYHTNNRPACIGWNEL